MIVYRENKSDYVETILKNTIRELEIINELKSFKSLNCNKLSGIIIDKALEENVNKRQN